MAIQEGTQPYLRHTAVTLVEHQPLADEKKLKEIFVKAKKGREINLCPVRDIITRFSDKWSMLVVLLLGAQGKMRFNEIRHQIGDVSQRMLTVTLRHLEQDGFFKPQSICRSTTPRRIRAYAAWPAFDAANRQTDRMD